MNVRAALEENHATVNVLARRLVDTRERLNGRNRKPRQNGPRVDAIFEMAAKTAKTIPAGLKLPPEGMTTLRGELGRVLQYYNKASDGAILAASADLLGSTSLNTIAQGFPEGYYNSKTNPQARLLSVGGICEDAMAGVLSGLATFGHHIGVGSSYGAFIAALGHVASRLHAIGNQARQAIAKEPYRTFILVCAHVGLKTGEDGPTHADPQALQLLQENFPLGTVITLTPWDPQEIWTLVSTALSKRPAMIAPFVTRPNEKVINREESGLAPAIDTASGVYRLRSSKGKGNGTLVLQGSDVAYAFIEETLPRLDKEGVNLNVYYVSSAELFDLLPASEQERIFPEAHAKEAMGITGFTLPTMYRWIRSDYGRLMTLHPFQKGHFLGSGQADMVMAEAGLDGESQFTTIMRYLRERG
jgi:transketolase